MKKWLCLLLAGTLLCSLAACHRGQNVDTLSDPTDTNTHISSGDSTKPNDTIAGNKEDWYLSLQKDKYVVQTPFYQIYEEGLQRYKYTIASGNHILAEDIKTGTAPQIDDKGDGILRLHLGFGTNAFTVKYFNVYNNTVSSEFNPYSIYADYINTATKEYYIAYFKPEAKPKLYIKGFFDSSEFSNELDLDFSMPTCAKLIFLNETEIYIEYIDSNSESIHKIVNFKN